MITEFVELLSRLQAPTGSANPYNMYQPGIDDGPRAPEIRKQQLLSYLQRRRHSAELLLVAEAPGYQGARFSGIAMTCERTLLDQKAGVPAGAVLSGGRRGQRTSHPDASRNTRELKNGFTEPTASIVWRELLRLNCADRVVLWNVYPFHPFKAGEPLSNRAPTDAEVRDHLDIFHDLRAVFAGCRIVCVGNTARNHLGGVYPDVPSLRHPANGGAALFRRGFSEIIEGR